MDDTTLPLQSKDCSDHPETSSSCAQDRVIKKKKKLLNGANLSVTYPNGSKYVGGFRDGKLHGYGVYTYAQSGDVYKGEWHADKKHGHGTYSYANGDMYIGEWYMGKKNGKGRFRFKGCDEYTGGWREDNMDGYGCFLIEQSGNRYAGYWKNGLRQGLGFLLCGNGDSYDGQWEEGKEHGFGVFRQVNGDVYCGEWSEGCMDGKGMLLEKGLLYAVEYIGGYVITKLPISEDSPQLPDDGWENANTKYCEWKAAHPDPAAPAESFFPKYFGVVNTIDQDAEALLAENAILRKRLEAMQQALHKDIFKQHAAEAGDAQAIALVEKYKLEHKEDKAIAEGLRTRILLLERSLEEKVLTEMRLQQEMRKKGALINDLQIQCEKYQKKLRCASGASRKSRRPPTVDDVDREDSTIPQNVDGELPSFAVREQKERTELLKAVADMQKKNAFLQAENAKLLGEVEAAEDRFGEAQAALERIRSECHGLSEDGNELEDYAKCEDKRIEENCLNPLIGSLPTPERTINDGEHIRLGRLNVDLTHSMGVLQSQAKKQHEQNMQIINTLKKTNAKLTEDNHALQSSVQALEDEADKHCAASSLATKEYRDLQKKYNDVIDQLTRTANKSAVAPALIKSLDEKANRIEKLESENAELARLLEETRAQLEEEQHVAHARQKVMRSFTADLALSDGHAQQLEKDLNKAHKKIKKLTNNYNSTALKLYETQLTFARAERLIEQMEGGIAVVVLIGSDTQSVSESSCITVCETDSSQVLVRHDEGGKEASKVFQFDCCFGADTTSDAIFTELCRPVSFVRYGFQVAYVTVGHRHAPISTLKSSWMALLTEYLCANGGNNEMFSSDTFSVSYRVAVVEITPHGGVDCASGCSITHVMRDDHGYVIPEGATYTDCTDRSVMDTIAILLERVSSDGISFSWVQVQQVVTNEVYQSHTVGRLTFLNLCAEVDPASSFSGAHFSTEQERCALRSFNNMRAVLQALVSKQATVPYSKTLETSLFFDLFGGNSMTTVIGHLCSSNNHVNTSVALLDALDLLSRVRNGPILQSYESPDVVRWRGIVSALNSDMQAEKLLCPVDDIRGA